MAIMVANGRAIKGVNNVLPGAMLNAQEHNCVVACRMPDARLRADLPRSSALRTALLDRCQVTT